MSEAFERDEFLDFFERSLENSELLVESVELRDDGRLVVEYVGSASDAEGLLSAGDVTTTVAVFPMALDEWNWPAPVERLVGVAYDPDADVADREEAYRWRVDSAAAKEYVDGDLDEAGLIATALDTFEYVTADGTARPIEIDTDDLEVVD